MTDKVRIYSDVTGLWWRPDGKGYTYIRAEAGLYTRADAKTKITDDPRRKERLIDEDDPFDPRTESRKETELLALRAQLATPLRLGRGPTAEEFRRHNATGGGWLLQGVGEDMGGWTMEMRPIPEADIPAMVRFTRDAIPLSSSRQPCGVGRS